MLQRAWWALALALAATGAQAAEVYRWTDAQGRVFYGDRPPEGRRGAATVVEIDDTPLPTARQVSPASAPRRVRPAAPASSAPAVIGESQALPRLVDRNTQCEEAWRRFDESSACFAPYRMGGGKVRAEAYTQCQTVVMPSDC